MSIMKTIILSMLTLLMIGSQATARTWTDIKGRKVEAEIVKIKPNKTVVLKTNGGKTVTIPFNTFVAEDVAFLESLPIGDARSEEHAVPWNKLNEIFGMAVWQDSQLWDDPTQKTADRMDLKKESQTAFMENHRAYPLGEKQVLDQPIYAVALYGDQSKTESISFIFLNLGDVPEGTDPKDVADLIETTGTRIHDLLEGHLGKAERDSLGKGDLREKVWRWDWNGHAIMLSVQDGKYAAMRIMPTGRADRSGRIAKLTDDDLKKRMATCVERRDNGDVVVTNIPMINQGPKGYCSPATWERYLRYMDIPADMYLLALAANTGVGGGTYSQEMIDATSNIISSNGRKLSKAGTKPSVRNVAKHIDKGLPIMWRLMSTPSFQQTANRNTARRNGKEIGPAGQAEDSGSGGHICLIVGYNEKTQEIAISDSWGARFAERWVPVADMEKATNGNMNIIRW